MQAKYYTNDFNCSFSIKKNYFSELNTSTSNFSSCKFGRIIIKTTKNCKENNQCIKLLMDLHNDA